MSCRRVVTGRPSLPFPLPRTHGAPSAVAAALVRTRQLNLEQDTGVEFLDTQPAQPGNREHEPDVLRSKGVTNPATHDPKGSMAVHRATQGSMGAPRGQ